MQLHVQTLSSLEQYDYDVLENCANPCLLSSMSTRYEKMKNTWICADNTREPNAEIGYCTDELEVNNDAFNKPFQIMNILSQKVSSRSSVSSTQ